MSVAELDRIAEAERARQAGFSCRLQCCASTACNSSGSAEVREALKKALAECNIADKVEMVTTGCMGLCGHGPLVRVVAPDRDELLLELMDADIAQGLIHDYIALLCERGEHPPLTYHLRSHVLRTDGPFFTRQVRLALANTGRVDPESIEDYIAKGGYQATRRALTEMTPEQVIAEISASQLRGRGGAGFPTGLKWQLTHEPPGGIKYMICNGDEGDPGAYMDRSILEGDPHAVIEGMIIGAYAIGTPVGYFYVRAEYPLAVERITKAIRQAKRLKLLGQNILGSNFSLDLDVRLGAGAFVCGEETALIASIEGSRGTPSPRPPYPSVSGLWGAPTCINNVETLANVHQIINRGAAWYAGIGTDKSKGTKVFALTGKVANVGLVEVPMGITLRELVMEIGGGSGSDVPIKAVQTGGPSGGVIPASLFDTPISYEDLTALGSIMGSGGLIVMDESDSMVGIAKFYTGFCVDESCGKCAPCRLGGKHMLLILENIMAGRGKPEDLELLTKICRAMQTASLCGLGQTAPNPVLSTLRYFRGEYEAAIAANPSQAGSPQGRM
ncbi:MAG: NADH-ubiquinone oxidoreductase-F iron-sulfur binding region domain-containing protein [Chloroflexota bacterium]